MRRLEPEGGAGFGARAGEGGARAGGAGARFHGGFAGADVFRVPSDAADPLRLGVPRGGSGDRGAVGAQRGDAFEAEGRAGGDARFDARGEGGGGAGLGWGGGGGGSWGGGQALLGGLAGGAGWGVLGRSPLSGSASLDAALDGGGGAGGMWGGGAGGDWSEGGGAFGWSAFPVDRMD